jgi:DNA mismatch repair protein MutS
MTPASNDTANLTPMMRQYFELKAKVPDAIILFRMGDFYEIFGDDAETVAPKLQLVLTSREKGQDQRVPFCGVPHHSARNYWIKLLRMGFKVAFVDQVEDPKTAKGLVRREITKVLSPGCIDDPEVLSPDDPNFLTACYEDPKLRIWAFAQVEVSTGEFRLGRAESLEACMQLVRQTGSCQVLVRLIHQETFARGLNHQQQEVQVLVDTLPEAPLKDKKCRTTILADVFGSSEIAAMPCGEVTGGAELAASILQYMIDSKLSCRPFTTIRPLQESNTMVIDPVAVRDLELLASARRGDSTGSLLREINRTCSPMGSRLFRHLLLHPLTDPKQILTRQSAAFALTEVGRSPLANLRENFSNTPDSERLLSRILSGTASTRDLASIREALRKCRTVLNFIEDHQLLHAPFFAEIAQNLNRYVEPLNDLQCALLESPGDLGFGNLVFEPAFSAELAHLNLAGSSGMSRVEAYEESLRRQTNINSLKIKQHKSFGLLIEVTRANAAKVPSDFIRRQTMVNCERFVTLELQDLCTELESAQDKAIQLESELYSRLIARLAEHREVFLKISHSMAWFDIIQSFAWKALESRFCLPRISVDASLKLKAARHPVVEHFVGSHQFHPNDIELDSTQHHVLITGPNMAGKSTIMRQVALIAILHQMGGLVPAIEAELPVFDRIFTRIGASDDLSRGQSTFMVEMTEAATILRQATAKSLVILDEVGRGTSTEDGLALATAIFESLVSRINCYTLFATHYHELVPIAEKLGRVRLMQNEVRKEGESIRFTHRFIRGFAESSYGIEVAKLAGIPQDVIERARFMLAEHKSNASHAPTETLEASVIPAKTGPLFETEEPSRSERDLISRIKKININRLTPLNALLILNELRESIENRYQAGLFDAGEIQ